VTTGVRLTYLAEVGGLSRFADMVVLVSLRRNRRSKNQNRDERSQKAEAKKPAHDRSLPNSGLSYTLNTGYHNL
jgi:hypothetical protein